MKDITKKAEKQECLPQDAKHRRTRRDLLHAEYVEGQKGGGLGQPEAGFKVSLLHAYLHALCGPTCCQWGACD